VGSFDYIRAESEEEALSSLADGEGRILAGGTYLVSLLRLGRLQARRLIDIARISSMGRLDEDEERIFVGGGVTFAQLARSSLIQRSGQLLFQAAHQVGSIQIRNVATVGGHVASRIPSGDGLLALVALGAQIKVRSSRRRSQMSLSKFLEAQPNQRTPEADEMIVGVEFLKPPPGTRHSFLKLGRREAFSISQLSLCMMLTMNVSGTIEQTAMAVGAAGPHPFRLEETERLLVGVRPTSQLVEETAEKMRGEVADHLGKEFSVTYKDQALRGFAREALSHCFNLNH
jgi:CO/xanthine dehydrogenase FAD-binding subunit